MCKIWIVSVTLQPQYTVQCPTTIRLSFIAILDWLLTSTDKVWHVSPNFDCSNTNNIEIKKIQFRVIQRHTYQIHSNTIHRLSNILYSSSPIMTLLPCLSDRCCIHCKYSLFLFWHHLQHRALGGVELLALYHLCIGGAFWIKFTRTKSTKLKHIW